MYQASHPVKYRVHRINEQDITHRDMLLSVESDKPLAISVIASEGLTKDELIEELERFEYEISDPGLIESQPDAPASVAYYRIYDQDIEFDTGPVSPNFDLRVGLKYPIVIAHPFHFGEEQLNDAVARLRTWLTEQDQ